MKLPSVRAFNFYAFLVCCGLLGTSAYFQFGLGLKPCPLCIIQRVIVVAFAVLFAMGALFRLARPIWSKIQSVFVLLTASGGIATAWRHMTLQHLPPEQVPACGPGVDYLIENLPLRDALRQIFAGSGECVDVQWMFLGFSMPEWMLVFFSLFALVAIMNYKRTGRHIAA